jgi:hypothetical protein
MGLIFILLCKINVEVNDGSSNDMENHPVTLFIRNLFRVRLPYLLLIRIISARHAAPTVGKKSQCN